MVLKIGKWEFVSRYLEFRPVGMQGPEVVPVPQSINHDPGCASKRKIPLPALREKELVLDSVEQSLASNRSIRHNPV